MSAQMKSTIAGLSWQSFQSSKERKAFDRKRARMGEREQVKRLPKTEHQMMARTKRAHWIARLVFSAAVLFCALSLGLAADARTKPGTPDSSISIPPGTILPVRLNSSLSSSKNKPGQIISATIMQDVPLPDGAKVRRGSKVRGHIVAVSAASTSSPANISLQFDTLLVSGQTIPIVTNLRALAGFVEVLEAQTPVTAPGESDVYRWLTTVQIGGDVVYGEEGPVASHNDSSKIIGKSVPYGVLAPVVAMEGTECRGAIDGKDSPQALWVFSSDACGVYGIQHLEITHAGRSDPAGVITLSSNKNNVSVHSGAGMLLRVDESANSTP
jgi:hypothetical protein